MAKCNDAIMHNPHAITSSNVANEQTFIFTIAPVIIR